MNARKFDRIKLHICLVLAFIFFYPSYTLACSGPGAAEAIAFNAKIGYAAFVFQVSNGLFTIVVLSKYKLHKTFAAYLIFFILSLVCHPLWLSNAYSGDCGISIFLDSIIRSILFASISAIIILRLLFAPKKINN